MESKESSPLRKLREESGKTVDEFAKQFSIASKTLTSYENGNRDINVDFAIKVCNEYNVSLDWLFGRIEYKNKSDIMLNIICALDKIFKIGYKTTTNPNNRYQYRELTLWIDKNFQAYLAEISQLQDSRRNNMYFTDEMYSTSRRSIQTKYKEYFQLLLGETNSEIDEDRFINIEAVEDCDFLKFLSI